MMTRGKQNTKLYMAYEKAPHRVEKCIVQLKLYNKLQVTGPNFVI